MAKGKISKQAVDALSAKERDVYLWDRELAGFGLKVTPTGAKVYLVQYRIGGRRSPTRRMTIGKHGSPWTNLMTGQVKSLTPDAARTEAKRILGLVAAGHDPAEEKSHARRDLTVTELCDLYLGEGCATQKASTLVSDHGRLFRLVLPQRGSARQPGCGVPASAGHLLAAPMRIIAGLQPLCFSSISSPPALPFMATAIARAVRLATARTESSAR
jgi:Arm DNA-binding domain